MDNLQKISGIDARLGVEYGRFAFVPTDLPEEIPLSNDSWVVIMDTVKELSMLEQASRQISSPELFVSPSLRREAQSTSALEGTYAPLEEILKVEDPGASISEDMKEIRNYITAAEYAFRAISEGSKVSVALLEDIHHILVNGTQSDGTEKGRVRSQQVIIGDPNQPIELARFVPMEGGLDLRIKLETLIRWTENSQFKDFPVILLALTHYQFETLHPFNDGNGRIGRLLIVLQLLQNKVASLPIISISPWLEKRKQEYKDELLNLSITGDWARWVRFFVEDLLNQHRRPVGRSMSSLRCKRSILMTFVMLAEQG